jgi:ribonuclease G
MNKEMIISSNGHETRVAILEDDQLAELFVEREQNRGVVGNVYKGRVSKVLPGMQSSFVDIGLERDGFLYVSDVIANLDEYDKDDEDDDGGKGAKAANGAEGAAANGAAVEGSSAQLKEGQDVIVQVAKEPLGTKGARLTCHVTLPGRFLVFMPTVDHIGISRKIDSRDERSRLRGIVKEFREQHSFNGGVIIRTAASGRSKDDILADLNYFYKIWVDMRQRGEQRRSPVTVYQEPSLVVFIGRIMPDLGARVKRYDKDFPIFEEYGVQAELDKALRSKVWLRSGGSIVINQTEALVAIDVNTGRYVGKKTAGRLEDTIIKTNLEAAKEIVRQIRLRDLGGIIVCDFIDMEEKKNRQKVFQAVEQELRKDRAPSKALQVSDFGLVIVTRKRVKQSLERVLTEPCPYCSGAGTIKSSATVCYEILSEVKKVGSDLDGPGVLLRVNPDIARALQEEERGVLKDLKNILQRDVIVKPDVHLHHEQFDVMSIGG